MSERIRNLIAVMVSAAVLSLAGIIALNFLGATPAKAEEGAGTLSERGAQADEQQQTPSSSGLLQKAEREGSVRVIVGLSTDFMPEGRLSRAEVADQRDAVHSAQADLQEDLQGTGYQTLRQYDTIPYIALNVSSRALQALERSPRVTDIMEDRLDEAFQDASKDLDSPNLAQSVPLVQAPTMWANGFTGSGQVVAVLDTGVDAAHPFLAGKVVEEACYSSTVAGTSVTFCPNGLDEQLGPGAAAPCPLHDCSHGTHVAGIAAGNGAAAGQLFSGVARDAQLMAVQVFSNIVDPASCGGIAPCPGAYTSDIIAGLERVYLVAAARNIVAVNMSLGGTPYSAQSDDQPYKPIIDNLRSIGVATVIASGNAGFTSAISSPACISSAVSVGSTDKSDTVSWFSNVSSFLSLFAPGESIVSSVPGGGYEAFSGTSMAAPHVAGSWAVMRSAVPGAAVSTIASSLQQTGLLISDTRFFGRASAPRIRVFQALGTLVPLTNPAPSIASVSPARVRAGSGTLS